MREKSKFNRIAGLIMVIVLGISLIPVGTVKGNDDTLTYLALGDSITTGYGLTGEEKSFVELFAEGIEADKTINEGVNGLTSAELLADIDSYAEKISQADVITITVGGNDLMDVLYSFMAKIYNDYTGNTSLTGDNMKDILANPTLANLSTISTLCTLLNSGKYDDVLVADNDFKDAVSDCKSNLEDINDYIYSKNLETSVFIINQYNPYQWLGDDYEGISSFFAKGVSYFNQEISTITGGTVVDIGEVFKNSSTALTNAYINVGSFSVDLDFHPNGAGHSVIAETLLSTYLVTFLVPIELTIEQGGTEKVPEQSFMVEILPLDYFAGDTETPKFTIADNSNVISVSENITYAKTLTFISGGYDTYKLYDGFLVRPVQPDVIPDGWSYDDSVYEITGAAQGDNISVKKLNLLTYDKEAVDSAKALFTCTYTAQAKESETSAEETTTVTDTGDTANEEVTSEADSDTADDEDDTAAEDGNSSGTVCTTSPATGDGRSAAPWIVCALISGLVYAAARKKLAGKNN